MEVQPGALSLFRYGHTLGNLVSDRLFNFSDTSLYPFFSGRLLGRMDYKVESGSNSTKSQSGEIMTGT